MKSNGSGLKFPNLNIGICGASEYLNFFAPYNEITISLYNGYGWIEILIKRSININDV